MEHLLTVRYPHDMGYYPKEPLAYPKVTYMAPFVLTDAKACSQCKQNHAEFGGCDEQMLFVDTQTPVTVLNFEAFKQQMDGTPAGVGSRCDYLIYDEYEHRHRIAFCDLTCSAREYVEPNDGRYPEGKRAKAYSQMKLSLEALLRVEMLSIAIMTYPSKVALFGWRERMSSARRADDAMASMLDFSITPDSEAGLLITDVSVMGKHFDFVQVKHPEHYQWNS